MAVVSTAAAAVPAEENSSRLCQFTKTKLCKFHVLGKCTKGTQCPFAHDGVDLRNLPDLRRTKLCKVLIQTGRCPNQGCLYAHTKEELRSTGAFHKTKLCRFMQTGHCTLGSKCNFAHSSVELREPETIETLEPPPGLGGWRSVLGGLLSDGEDFEDNSGDAKHKADTRSKSKEDSLIDAKPAYVHIGQRPDTSTFGSANISEIAKSSVTKDASLNAFWDVRSQLASNAAMGMPAPSPWDANLAYGGAFHDWAGPWGGSPFYDPYGSALGGGFGSFAGPPLDGGCGGWDWSLFGPSGAVDQMGEMRAKSAKPANKMPKVRAPRPSESTLSIPVETIPSPEKA